MSEIRACQRCTTKYCPHCDVKSGGCTNCGNIVCGDCRSKCMSCGKFFCDDCIKKALTGDICVSCLKEAQSKKEDKANLTPRELAERWSLTVGTITNWRVDGKGPKFIKLGNNRVVYPLSEVIRYESEKLKKNTV